MSALRLLLIREWEFLSSSSQFLKVRPVKPLGVRLMSWSGIPGVKPETNEDEEDERRSMVPCAIEFDTLL